jgi:Holliday junction DNA helicase RuvB
MFGQEKLGIIMENYLIETGRPNKYYWTPYFTLIGATTMAGELSKPFLNRFKLNFMFQPYSFEESVQIVYMHAKRLNLMVSPLAAEDIAKRGRGVPRIMIGYLECCRDTAIYRRMPVITDFVTRSTFNELEIDEEGLTRTELKILETLYNAERPIGLDTLSVVTGESAKTIKNELETYLMQNGYIVRSGAGRIVTQKGRLYLEEKGFQGRYRGRLEISGDYVRR